MSPIAWAAFRKLRTGTELNSSLLGAGTEDAQQLLLSLPIIVSVAVPALTGFVIDKTAVVSAYGEVQVNTSDHQFFTSDSVAVRCTSHVGHNVVRPNRIGTFTIAGGGSYQTGGRRRAVNRQIASEFLAERALRGDGSGATR